MAKRNYAKRETKEYNFLTEVFQWFSVWVFTMPYILLFYRVKVEGFKNLKKGVSYLVAPTHSGYLDPIVTSYATQRPIAYMAKKELYDKPILGPIIVALGTFAVNRQKLEIATIRTAQAIMKTNHWLISMFPQGTRDSVKEITQITPGFAYLARMAKAQILPISITGTDKFSKIPFGGKIVIKIGAPFEPSKELADTMQAWCNAIKDLGDYTISEKALAKIEKAREKDKHESADSEG